MRLPCPAPPISPFRKLVLTAILVTATALPAAADISRGCSASIYVRGPQIHNGYLELMQMDASGTCRRTDPNQCRVRANNALRNCAQALWATRLSHGIPSECLPAHGGGSARMNWTRWVGIHANLPHGADSLVDRVRRETCCPSNSFDVEHVQVTVSISGDYGCSGVNGRFQTNYQGTLDSAYRVDCGRLRARGICGSVPQRTNP